MTMTKMATEMIMMMTSIMMRRMIIIMNLMTTADMTMMRMSMTMANTKKGSWV